ncbi:hypothetical protein HPP92_014106 [Vanilla planifolia]|uniref:Uncharacterized protein n=1 Tax=Vanilla planifolia TaxID=51239 RepID=A0A835QQA5_VANPL|nr:hypothetical protein HPP92_014106 [Vanilla planifolia]
MTEFEIFRLNFGSVIGALKAGKFPEKDCLLPLVWKVLGYGLVAVSTTVKVPQASQHAIFFCARLPKSGRISNFGQTVQGM